MTTRCLCQMCTCGHHQCPRSPPPAVIQTLTSDRAPIITEYRDKFHTHVAARLRTSKKARQEIQLLEGSFANSTTFRDSYIPHRLTLRQPYVPKACDAPTGDMLSDSTYMMDFKPNTANKCIVKNTVQCNRPTAKMDTNSNYQANFRCWELTKRYPIRPTDNLKVNEGKFDIITTFQDNFCPKPTAEVRESLKPIKQIITPQPFEGQASYSLAYVPYPVQCRQPKQEIPYKPNSAPLRDISVQAQDFRGQRGETARSCKPKTTWEASSIPFEGSSETKDRFKPWLVPPIYKRKMEKYTPPKGGLDSLSVTHGDFIGRQGRPALSTRPPMKAWCKGVPLNARSTMKEDYRVWESKKRSIFVSQGQFEPPSGAFEATTTCRSDYQAKTAPKTCTFKPSPRVRSPPTTIDANAYQTSYQTSFVSKGIKPCPVSFSNPPGFEYSTVGNSGHTLYRTLSTGERVKTRPATTTATSSKTSHTFKNRPVSATPGEGKIIY